jgi:hypothetical protein
MINHVIALLLAVIAILKASPEGDPTNQPTLHKYQVSAYKTDQQFEKRIAYVNAQNNHLRLEIAELKGYLRTFAPHKSYPLRREFL